MNATLRVLALVNEWQHILCPEPEAFDKLWSWLQVELRNYIYDLELLCWPLLLLIS